MSVSVTFDLKSSNSIFKKNLESLLVISRDNLELIANQNLEYFTNTDFDNTKETEWFDKSSHLNNIEWLLLNSIYTSLYSFFEYHLYALVKVVEKRSSSKIRLKDISGKGIVQFFTYLNLVGELESASKTNRNWQDLLRFQKVRNLLVHNGGVMLPDMTKPLKDHELFSFLNTNKVIMAGTLGHIRIRETKILESFIDLTFSISDSLVAEINSKYPDKFH